MMSNSSLICYKKISPNKTVCKNKVNDTVSIHCMAGQLSVETCGNLFADSKTQASSNYGIGPDGRIALYVEEKDRAYCTSNRENDMRAVTIEVASNKKTPYTVTNAAYNALIELLVDICKRNSIKKLIWSDIKDDRVNHKNGCNMTVHRDYTAKACPGEYLYSRMREIASTVNKKLNGCEPPYTVRVTSEKAVIRKLPRKNSKEITKVNKGEVYTIIEKRQSASRMWGKLKSGIGWINLKNTEKI